MDRSVRTRDVNNRPFVSLSKSEAISLVAYGCAVWDGRKQKNLRFHFSRNALLKYLGEKRFTVEVHPRAIDSRTFERLYPLGYQHARWKAYSPENRAIETLTEGEFLQNGDVGNNKHFAAPAP